MKPLFFLILTFAFAAIYSPAQTWDEQWEKVSANKNQDYYSDVLEIPGGGFAVLGAVNTNPTNVCLLCFTDSGDLTWNKTFESADNELPAKIAITPEGSLVILSQKNPADQSEILIRKTDLSGKEISQSSLNGMYFKGADIAVLNENEWVVAGAKGTDAEHPKLWMAKLDEKGNVAWEKTFNETTKGCFSTIKHLPDGGFVLGGQVAGKAKNDCDMIVIRTDSEGNALWTNRMDSPKSKEWAECVCCSPDSCFMLVGWGGNCLNDMNDEYPIFDFDLILKKVDCNGKVKWAKNFDAEGSEGGYAIAIRPDGHFIVAGTKESSFAGKVGPWIMEVDGNGEVLNELLLNMRFSRVCKVLNTKDGGFVVIGPGFYDNLNPRSDGWIAKFSAI
ncbi:hypothetical protein [Maribellus sp. YY47]|uniref:hypothetical protein n=1 Tax=Maribellus sp. YY47 TaxID=2929486 RepID=UPI0020014850|nr:hypothetical protein [Maribellus sp. YY47]MCK3683767.1 hypothetical protein [Maribellus sp. YY47]